MKSELINDMISLIEQTEIFANMETSIPDIVPDETYVSVRIRVKLDDGVIDEMEQIASTRPSPDADIILNMDSINVGHIRRLAETYKKFKED